MDAKITVSKHGLRKDILMKLSCLAYDQILGFSRAVMDRIVSCPAYIKASHISVFVSLPSELQTDMLIERAFADQKLVSIPMVTGPREMSMIPLENYEDLSSLECSSLGIRQPRADSQSMEDHPLDLLIVPGLAFSPTGGRLGRGRGYYDKFSSKLTDSQKAPFILMGVCLDEQLLSHIPTEEHDYRMHYVVTPSHFYMCIEQ